MFYRSSDISGHPDSSTLNTIRILVSEDGTAKELKAMLNENYINIRWLDDKFKIIVKFIVI